MPTLPRVGDELAGYRLRGVLGRGGMSVVYEAENPRLGSVVALKVLAPELATDDVFRARFLKESRIAASLNHPNVIPIYDVGSYEDLLYIAMRYVAGADLRAVLKAQHFLSPSQALLLIGQAGRALDSAHRHGLVHRDVKPGNFLIEHAAEEDDADHVYLTDFGITKHAASRSGLTGTGEFMGTIDYIAPEQIKGGPVDGRADIYSLGCVLYECLTGRVPFAKDVDAAVIWAHVEEEPTMPSALRPALPPAIDEVMTHALAKDPGERYPTCRALVGAAHAALPDGPTAQPRTATVLSSRNGPGTASRQPASPPPPKTGEPAAGDRPSPDPAAVRRRPKRRWRLLAALGVLILIIAAASAWLDVRGKPHSAAQPMQTPLMKALAGANTATHGLLPPDKCHSQSASVVTCTNPAFAVDTVNFHTYPSQKALYSAYVAAVRAHGNRAGANSIRTNFGNCSLRLSSGEVSWNHDFVHPKIYSLAQSRSGRLRPADQSAGRVFCTILGSQYHIVWTEDSGHLLAQMSGGPHDQSWKWWRAVHHNITFPSTSMHM